jgi:hypothetical protein
MSGDTHICTAEFGFAGDKCQAILTFEQFGFASFTGKQNRSNANCSAASRAETRNVRIALGCKLFDGGVRRVHRASMGTQALKEKAGVNAPA